MMRTLWKAGHGPNNVPEYLKEQKAGSRATDKTADKTAYTKMKHFSLEQTLLCDHSLESSLRDDFNEWSQHSVWWRIEELWW